MANSVDLYFMGIQMKTKQHMYNPCSYISSVGETSDAPSAAAAAASAAAAAAAASLVASNAAAAASRLTASTTLPKQVKRATIDRHVLLSNDMPLIFHPSTVEWRRVGSAHSTELRCTHSPMMTEIVIQTLFTESVTENGTNATADQWMRILLSVSVGITPLARCTFHH